MKKLIFIIVLVCGLQGVSAQELTLERCREMALENNISKSVAGAQSQIADYTVKQMRANFLPNFSVSGLGYMSSGATTYTLAGGYLPTFVPNLTTGEMEPNIMTSNGAPVLDASGNVIFNQYAYSPDINLDLEVGTVWNTSLVLEQPIYMGGKIAAGYKMSKLGVNMAALYEKLTDDQVVLESDQAYWNCVRAQAMVVALEQYFETVESFYRDINNAVEVGMKTSNDRLKVQVQLNEAELNLMKARNAGVLAKMNLCHVIGLALNSQITVVESDQGLLMADYDGYNVEDRTEYQMLTKKIEINEQNERVVRADYLPNIGVAGTVGYTQGLKLNGQTVFNDASYGALVSLSIPIFHWGEGRSKVNIERRKTEIMRLEREDMAQKMELEINQALNSLIEARLQARFVENSLTAAQENMRVVRNGYDAGRETLSNLLEAQTMWQKALTEKVDSDANLRVAQTTYLKTIGRLTDR